MRRSSGLYTAAAGSRNVDEFKYDTIIIISIIVAVSVIVVVTITNIISAITTIIIE